MKLIQRVYLQDLLELSNTPDIKVITGIRRAGKSKLLESFISEIQSHNDNSNIIHINFNLNEFEELKDFRKLYDFIESRYVDGQHNYILIDEIQLCNGFEQAVIWLHASEKYDIYITGSNAFLLSSDLATMFTGRTMEIEVFPFSFSEFYKYYGYTENESAKALTKYIEEGGMPGSYLYNDINRKYDYIKDVLNSLLIKDIVKKYKIRNVALLDKLIDFMFDSIGCELSENKISNSLNSSGLKINHNTIGMYLSYLCNGFLFYRVRRYDIQGKRYLNSQDKYYLSDHSFRYARIGTKNQNTGRILENIIAIELLRRGYELYTGVLYNKEIDFVALRRNEKLYIQVADDISNTDTLIRESTSLLSIKDAYPKIILARTNEKSFDYNGVQIIDIASWLTVDSDFKQDFQSI